MNRQQKILAAIAAFLVAAAVFSWTTWPVVCLASALPALALSLYLRHRGAFRSGNTPLAGAFLIAGSALMTFAGVGAVNLGAALVVCGAVLIPTLLLLLAFGLRERARGFRRNMQEILREDQDPPP